MFSLKQLLFYGKHEQLENNGIDFLLYLEPSCFSSSSRKSLLECALLSSRYPESILSC